ncbi:MAG: DUF7139 domain-containing protein [Halohasta sp.]
MTDLSEAYKGTVASQQGRHRLYLGVGLFCFGAVLLAVGIIAAGSGLLTSRGYSIGQTRWVGGILGGLGLPALSLGVFTVLPADRRTRTAALVGASLSVFGVAIFAHAYPCQWIGTTCANPGTDLTLPTAGVYALGTLTTVWCLFIGVANFKIRNDPGGTVTMEITREGRTETVEVERSELGGFGGIGFFGSTPDGEVETQTNPRGRQPAAGTTSDGGATAESLSSPLDASATETTEGPDGSRSTGVDRIGPGTPSRSGEMPTESSVDRYCGSCAEFKYVRTDTGIRPYCGYHDELMDDMDACEEWRSR